MFARVLGVEKNELFLRPVVNNANWFGHCGKQYGGSWKHEKQNYRMLQGRRPRALIPSLLQKHLHLHVHCTTVPSGQDMEPTSVFTNGWMGKENVTYIHRGILFSREKAWNPDICNSVDRTEGQHVKLSQTLENKHCVFSLVRGSGEAGLPEVERWWLPVAGRAGEGMDRGGLTDTKGHRWTGESPQCSVAQ